jgi:hypothetical protein
LLSLPHQHFVRQAPKAIPTGRFTARNRRPHRKFRYFKAFSLCMTFLNLENILRDLHLATPELLGDLFLVILPIMFHRLPRGHPSPSRPVMGLTTNFSDLSRTASESASTSPSGLGTSDLQTLYYHMETYVKHALMA